MNSQLNNWEIGSIIPGTVVSLEAKGALIDIGIEELVFIKLEEISSREIKSAGEVLEIGETREFLIINDFDSERNRILGLSIQGLEYQILSERLRQLYQEQVSYLTKVEEIVEQGILVKVEGRIGLIPNLFLNTPVPLETFIDKILPVKILKIEYYQPILSISWEMMNTINNFDEENIPKKSYNPGDIVTGTVAKIEPEGAWIDIGEAKLFYLPISELSLNKVDSVEEVLELNQMREFLIGFYFSRGFYTFSLSIRLLEEKIAWERVSIIHQENATIYAKFTSINERENNIVARLYIEGLRSFTKNLNIGLRQPIKAEQLEQLKEKIWPLKIIEINQSNHRILLRRVEKDEDVIKPGDLITGKIFTIKPYGAFVNIGHFAVLLHISEISHASFEKVEDIFQQNDEIKAVVVATDISKGRVAISTKVLEPAAGDMLKNPQLVYEKAEEMAEKYRQQLTDINPHQYLVNPPK